VAGHVRVDWISAIAFLYTKDLMEVERYEAITKKVPREYQYRVAPMEDVELDGFSLGEKMIAWTVKYALEKVVIVISCNEWSPSKELELFAEDKRVKIQMIPLSIIPSEMIDGLRHMHFISGLLKKELE